MLDPEVSVGILIVIVVGIVVLILNYYRQQPSVVEGMNSGNDNSKNDSSSLPEIWHLNKAGDSTRQYTNELGLNLKDKKDDYSKIIENLDEHVAQVQLKYLHEMTKSIATNPTAEDTINAIKRLNILSEFRRTLLHQMKYIESM